MEDSGCGFGCFYQGEDESVKYLKTLLLIELMEIRPSQEEFLNGVSEYHKHEKRDAMYKVAKMLVNDYWGRWDEVANGLGVLLLTWNQALYRYGVFDFDKLEHFLKSRQNELNEFRNRAIDTLNKNDEAKIKSMFEELLVALASEGKNKKPRKSPVAVAKALHMLAPDFFPIWDNAIAYAYGCYWTNSGKASQTYIDFCWKNKALTEYIKGLSIPNEKKRELVKVNRRIQLCQIHL